MREAALCPELAQSGGLEHPADFGLRGPLVVRKAALISELTVAGPAEEIADLRPWRMPWRYIVRKSATVAELARASALKEMADVHSDGHLVVDELGPLGHLQLASATDPFTIYKTVSFWMHYLVISSIHFEIFQK